MMGKELYLPEITNSWLKDRVYYYISNDCLRLDACVDVSFNLGDFKYAKSFSAFVELDFCKYMLKFGFEGKTRSLILISYNWGKVLYNFNFVITLMSRRGCSATFFFCGLGSQF